MEEGLTTEHLEQIRRSLAMATTLPRDTALMLLAEIHRLRAELAGETARRHPAG